MVKNKYPLLLLSSAFEVLSEAQIVTKLDLRNAYHLVHLHKGDEWKTVFNSPLGQYKYSVMPFSLTNAPAVFEALINDLRDFLDHFVFVYLEDIFPGLQKPPLRRVFQRFLGNRLFFKAEKCEFHVDTVNFL